MSAESPKYGRLTVLRELEPRRNACGKSKRMVWAVCECGAERAYQLGNLKTGNTTSCGCHRRENLDKHNAARAVPQVWTVEGDIAYLEVTGKKVLIDAADVPLVSNKRWYVDESGYVYSCGDECAMHRVLFCLKPDDKRQVDHKFHVNWDNRRSQIRIATSQQNHFNARPSRHSSKFKGVHFDKESGMYRAIITRDGKTHSIGRYYSEEKAARSYDRVAAKLFGEFAYLNFGGKRVG